MVGLAAPVAVFGACVAPLDLWEGSARKPSAAATMRMSAAGMAKAGRRRRRCVGAAGTAAGTAAGMAVWVDGAGSGALLAE